MRRMKWIVTLILACLLALSMTACGESNDEKNGAALSGTITAAGSTALQPLAKAAADEFTKNNPSATVNVQPGGSGVGLTQVVSGAAEIGNSDIFAEEKSGVNASSLVDHKVCVIGFGVVVNNDVKIDNLSKDQLVGIFTGTIKNWKEVGGDDKKITIINRTKSSGTRATFKKYALDGKDEAEGLALTEDTSGAVKDAIQKTSGSIGYLALSYLDVNVRKDVKVIKLDNVEANKENITAGKYPIWSYEHMYTKGQPTGLTKAYLDYMVSSSVKPLVDKLGYIPISEMKVKR